MLPTTSFSQQRVFDESSLIKALDVFEEQGCDELILVPTSADIAELERTLNALAKR